MSNKKCCSKSIKKINRKINEKIINFETHKRHVFTRFNEEIMHVLSKNLVHKICDLCMSK